MITHGISILFALWASFATALEPINSLNSNKVLSPVFEMDNGRNIFSTTVFVQYFWCATADAVERPVREEKDIEDQKGNDEYAPFSETSDKMQDQR